MLVARFLVIGAVLVIVATLLAYAVTGQRKYLQFAVRLFKIGVGLILLLLILLAADHGIRLMKSS